MSVALALLLFSNCTVYGVDLSDIKYLRVPFLCDKHSELSEEGSSAIEPLEEELKQIIALIKKRLAGVKSVSSEDIVSMIESYVKRCTTKEQVSALTDDDNFSRWREQHLRGDHQLRDNVTDVVLFKLFNLENETIPNKKDGIEELKHHRTIRTILGEDAGKYLKTKVRWEIGDFGLIADVFAKADTGYKFDVDARLVGVQLLSMLGVHHNTVREMLEKIVQEDVDETVRQKALSVLTSYVKIVIGTKRVIEIGDYKDIRKRAIDALNELREKGCYAAEVIFETYSEGNVESATFAVYSLTQGNYINLTEKDSEVDVCWGNVVWLENDKGLPNVPFAHIHIALTNGKGGHLQAINAKGTLTIRPLWGVRIGRDYEVVTDGRKFDPWKMREEKIPKGIRGQEGIVIRLNDDEDLVAQLYKIAKAEGIKKASFRAIGALDKTKDPHREYQSSVTYINSKTGKEETRQVYHEYLAQGEYVNLNEPSGSFSFYSSPRAHPEARRAEGSLEIFRPLPLRYAQGQGPQDEGSEKHITPRPLIYLADENGRMELHRLVRLNNVALGEIVMEIIVGENDRRDKGTDKGNFKTYRVPGRNGLRLAL